MPCNSIILQSVNLEQCGDIQLLIHSVQAIADKMTLSGMPAVKHHIDGSIWFAFEGRDYRIIEGKISGDARFVGKIADSLKREYAKQSIFASAKKNGWTVKQFGENRFQVIKH